MAKKPTRGRARTWDKLRRLFTPTRENGRHPHLLRGNVIIGAIALVILVEVGVLAQTLYFSQTPGMTASVLQAVVADLTNQEREQDGLADLQTSPLLQEAAQEKADDMAAKGYFSHVSPSGQLPWYWFQQVGYNYQFAGENLAVNFTDSQDVVTAWMNSPMHRANILKQQYTQIGIGIAQGTYEGQETTFVVEFFGTPEPPTPSVARGPAPVRQNPAQVAPTTPVETVAAPAVAHEVVPQVLGAQSATPQVSPWMKMLSSPTTYATYLLLAIAAIFFGLLLISFVPRMFRISEHLPHPNALLNGAALLAVIFGIMILNQHVVSGVRVDAPDSQNAAVVRAVQ